MPICIFTRADKWCQAILRRICLLVSKCEKENFEKAAGKTSADMIYAVVRFRIKELRPIVDFG